MSQEDNQITSNEFLDWTSQRVTQAFLAAINGRIKELFIEIGNGRTLDVANSSVTQAETARLVGKIEGLQEVLDLDIVKE